MVGKRARPFAPEQHHDPDLFSRVFTYSDVQLAKQQARRQGKGRPVGVAEAAPRPAHWPEDTEPDPRPHVY